MQVVSNHKQPTHGRVINGLLKDADEVIICAAFLKKSGLKEMKTSLPENCTCYIGTDYYLTEPAALRQLLDSGVKLWLTETGPGSLSSEDILHSKEKPSCYCDGICQPNWRRMADQPGMFRDGKYRGWNYIGKGFSRSIYALSREIRTDST